MSALENAKNMSVEEILAKTAASGLLEFGVERSVVTEKWNQVNAEREFQTNPIRVVAGLNNADIAGVQLEVLKADPKKVMEGMAIAALAVNAEEMYLYLPEKEAEYAKELEAKEGLTFIHPFNDLTVATGQGTIAMEIFKELPTVDIILVPIGGGGLAAGVSTLAKLLNPNIKVIGVEPAGASCMKASLDAGKVVTLPNVETIADGTAVKTPGDKIFPYIQKNIDEIIAVEDEELIVNFLDILENHKMLVENSGLLTVAALKHLDCKGKRVVSILSGGNMDIITLSSVVQHGLIARGRVFTVAVQLPDRPGELVNVADIIAKEKGNVIRLEHNQFVSINRNAAVELRITLEAFGQEHKNEILKALRDKGYDAKEETPTGMY